MSSVSIRVDVSGIPHSFLVVTHPDGRQTEYDLVPQDHSKDGSYGAAGPGDIDITGPGVELPPHESDFQGTTQQLSDTQYQKLMEWINRSIANPPDYLVTGNWSTGTDAMNCTGWAISMWRYAGIPDSFGVTEAGDDFRFQKVGS